jgi:type IX secretion system PorP/SprF family membrane protein
MKKGNVLLLVFFILSTMVYGQTYTHTSTYRQFFYNPYLFNPAFVGINGTEINLSYRQQWINFEDAPVMTGINYQHQSSGKVSFGFNLTSDKQVLLKKSSGLLTFGYTLPLGENHSLRFGLSGGVGLNTLDLDADELNSSDPAVINASNNSFYVDGNVGLVYNISNLRIGFAITDLFNSQSFTPETFNKFSLSNLRNRLYSISYRFNVGIMENFSIEPYFLYKQSQDGLQDSWEAASLIYYRNKVWTGAGYNENKGLAAFFGMNIKEKFKFSYSYEFPPFKSGEMSTSSHELHLTIKLGKKKAIKTVTTSKPQPKLVLASEPEEPVAEKEDSVDTESPENKTPGAPAKNISPESAAKKAATNPVTPEKQSTGTPTSSRPAKSFTVARGHYVVVGVFSMIEHSTRFTKQLMRNGYSANVTLNPKNHYYYVYIFSTYDLDEARRVRNQYRWKNLFKEAWVFTMD